MYGLYKIDTNIFGALYVIIMQNLINYENKLNSLLKFDLKGSTVARYVQVDSIVSLKKGCN